MNELNINGEGRPNVERLGMTPPNQADYAGAKAVGSTHELGRAMSPVTPGNAIFKADAVGGSQPQPRSASPVHKPDDKFSIGDARMGQPQSTIVAGKGSVPIRPSGSNAGTSTSYIRKGKA